MEDAWTRWLDGDPGSWSIGSMMIDIGALVVSLLLGYAVLVHRQRAERREWDAERAAERRRTYDPGVFGGAEYEGSRDLWWDRYDTHTSRAQARRDAS